MPTGDDSLTPGGTTIRRAFETLVSTLHQFKIRYAIIGGQAINQHIRPRGTDDVDALVLVPQLVMPAFFEALIHEGFQSDILQNIRELRDQGMTSLLYEDVPVDLMRPKIPAHDHVLERAIPMQIRGQKVNVSSAEGLIVLKLAAFRAQDEADIRQLLSLYCHQLDLAFIRAELSTFAGADEPKCKKFEEWVRESLHQPDGNA